MLDNICDSDFEYDLVNMLSKMNLPVVGNYYRPVSAQQAYTKLKNGDRVILKFDPTNKYDANAICVITTDGQKDIHIGWINAADAKRIVNETSKCRSDHAMNHINLIDIELEAKVITRGTSSSRMIIQITQATII